MKWDNQLRYAVLIIKNFPGDSPLHNWLKQFFRQHKQMGSKDRKQIADLVYSFYRLGQGLKEVAIEERILAGIFLCNQTDSEILQYFKPAWNEKIGIPRKEKYNLIEPVFYGCDIFPWENELSGGMDYPAFCESFLIQPDLFLRIRPGKEKTVIQQLQKASIPYRQTGPMSIALPNTTHLDTHIAINRDAVIQDYSSQQTGEFISLDKDRGSVLKVWDCCAGSGGKSILSYDNYPGIELTVSDIRESILIRLKKRFLEAGINSYTAFAADLSSPGIPVPRERYDMILADLPCTGSGTWSRTPEALYFFDPGEIAKYSSLQKKIISTVIPSLKKGGILLYSTCSVFKKENEEISDFIQQHFGLRPEKMGLIKGYENKADSMFVARFQA